MYDDPLGPFMDGALEHTFLSMCLCLLSSLTPFPSMSLDDLILLQQPLIFKSLLYLIKIPNDHTFHLYFDLKQHKSMSNYLMYSDY